MNTSSMDRMTGSVRALRRRLCGEILEMSGAPQESLPPPPALSSLPLVVAGGAQDCFTHIVSEEYADWTQPGAGRLPNMEHATGTVVVGPLRLSLRFNHVLVSAFGGESTQVCLVDGTPPESFDAVMVDGTTFLLVLGGRGSLELFYFTIGAAPRHPIEKIQGLVAAMKEWVCKAWFVGPSRLVVLTTVGTVFQETISVTQDLVLGSGSQIGAGWRHTVSSLWFLVRAAAPPQIVLTAFSAPRKCLAFVDAAGVLRIDTVDDGCTFSSPRGFVCLVQNAGTGSPSTSTAVALNISASLSDMWLVAVSFSNGSHNFYSLDRSSKQGGIKLWDTLPPSSNVSHVSHVAMGAHSILCYDPVQAVIEMTHFAVPFYLSRTQLCRIVTTLVAHRVPSNSVARLQNTSDSFMLFGPEEATHLRVCSPSEILVRLVTSGKIAAGKERETVAQLIECLGGCKVAELVIEAIRGSPDLPVESRKVLVQMFSAMGPPVVRVDGIETQVTFGGAVAGTKAKIDLLLHTFEMRKLHTLLRDDLVQLQTLTRDLGCLSESLEELFTVGGWLGVHQRVPMTEKDLMRMNGPLCFILRADDPGKPLDRPAAASLQALFIQELIEGLRRARDMCAMVLLHLECGLLWPPDIDTTLPAAAWSLHSATNLAHLFDGLVKQTKTGNLRMKVLKDIAHYQLLPRLPRLDQRTHQVLLLAADGSYDGCLDLIASNMRDFLEDPGRLLNVLEEVDAAEPSRLFLMQGCLMAIRFSPEAGVVPRLLESIFSRLDTIEHQEIRGNSFAAPGLQRAIELLIAASDVTPVGQALAEWTIGHSIDTDLDLGVNGYPRIRDHAENFARIVTFSSLDRNRSVTTAYFFEIRAHRACGLDEESSLDPALRLLDLAEQSTEGCPSSAAFRLSLDGRAFIADEALRIATGDSVSLEYVKLRHETIIGFVAVQKEILALLRRETQSRSVAEMITAVSWHLLDQQQLMEITEGCRHGAPLQLRLVCLLADLARKSLQLDMSRPIIDMDVSTLPAVLVAALQTTVETARLSSCVDVQEICEAFISKYYHLFKFEYGVHFPLLEVIVFLTALETERKIQLRVFELLCRAGISPRDVFETYVLFLDDDRIRDHSPPALKPLEVLKIIDSLLGSDFATSGELDRVRCADHVLSMVEQLVRQRAVGREDYNSVVGRLTELVKENP
jgi:hypothetical protein